MYIYIGVSIFLQMYDVFKLSNACATWDYTNREINFCEIMGFYQVAI